MANDCITSVINNTIGHEVIQEHTEHNYSDTMNMTMESNGQQNLLEQHRLDETNAIVMSSTENRLKFAFNVLVRFLVPFCNGLVRGWNGIRGFRVLSTIKNIPYNRQALTNAFAFAANNISLGLSTSQVVHRIDPLLKLMKIRKRQQPNVLLPPLSSERSSKLTVSKSVNPAEILPEKCVTLNVLAEPPPGVPIRADIIFIHGLHGSLVNTWKQGMWNSEGRQVKFQRPPKPPIRPPKRPRYSRTTLDHPHLMKRQRLHSRIDDESKESSSHGHTHRTIIDTYECSSIDNVELIDDIEYSFPTFRLRLDDGDNKEYASIVDGKPQPRRRTKSVGEVFSSCWPGDWLPLDCPGVRVIAVNYTTDPYLWRPMWIKKRNRSGLATRAREMAEMLIEKNVGANHPIIWVGHSKGGIFIKQIVVDAWESGRQAAANLWKQSRGMFFYSVPHLGSPLADFNLPFLRQSIELMEIKKNCSGMVDLHRRFVALYRAGHLKVELFSFVETALTLMSVLYLRIVGIDSADPGIGDVCGVHLDHREICKPRNRECILYTELAKMINRLS